MGNGSSHLLNLIDFRKERTNNWATGKVITPKADQLTGFSLSLIE